MHGTMAVPYEYAPLARRNIRLLQVWIEGDEGVLAPRPDLGSINEDIALNPDIRVRVRFVQASLDDLQYVYHAISYVWGQPDRCRRIWFDDDVYLDIPDSAFRAILCIHVNWKGVFANHLWIDAVCINQLDMVERSDQVHMMYDVYSMAQAVIAWLGVPTEDSSLAFEFMERLSTSISEMIRAGKRITRDIASQVEGGEGHSREWVATSRLVGRPFFKRLWIIQEMVAARRIVLVCGQNACSWEAPNMLLNSMQRYGLHVFLDTPDEITAISAARGMEGLRILSWLREQIKESGSFPPFPTILSHCRRFGATDPRDKVFALLNVANLTHDQTLIPNYNKTSEEVFTWVTRELLTQKPAMLSLLCMAGVGYDRKLTKLPSWVPDWSVESERTLLGSPPTDGLGTGTELYNASYTSHFIEPNITCVDDTTITIHGRIIDIIRTHHSGMPQPGLNIGDGPIKNSKLIFQWLVQLSRIFPEGTICPSGSAFFPDALSQTLVAEDDVSKQNLDSDFVNFCFLHYMMSVSSDAPISSVLDEQLYTLFSRIPSQPTEEQRYECIRSCQSYHGRLHCRLRRIFTTELGYVGLGPLLVAEGDLVCMIPGMRVPFLLRRGEKGGAQVVGECYIHGLMHGEGMSMGTEQEIVLY